MLCAGCGRCIEDRVVLSVNGLLWHGDCLQCCQCRQPLTDKCFCRDNKFYCRADYLRYLLSAHHHLPDFVQFYYTTAIVCCSTAKNGQSTVFNHIFSNHFSAGRSGIFYELHINQRNVLFRCLYNQKSIDYTG